MNVHEERALAKAETHPSLGVTVPSATIAVVTSEAVERRGPVTGKRYSILTVVTIVSELTTVTRKYCDG